MIAGFPVHGLLLSAACRRVFSLLKRWAAPAGIALALAACGGAQTDRIRLEKLDPELCQQEHTPISTIQGNQFSSPLQSSQHSILAVVTHIVPATGLFMEQPLADGDPATSDGLWIESARLAEDLKIGDQALIRGQVTELGRAPHSLTSLTAINGAVRCAENQPLPLHETGLPLDVGQRESLEGMRVQMQQNFRVTSVRDAQTRGQIRISLGSRLTSPTERLLPGEEAAKAGRRDQQRQVVLQWTDYADESLLDANPSGIRVNDGVFQFSGVLSDTRWQYAVITESFGWLPINHNIPAPVPHQGNLRVSSLNVLNYFNGDGAGGGFPTQRGAKTLEEFEQQRGRLVSAITAMDPDVLGLMELENDGYGPESAIQDLATTLNQLSPDAGWRVATPHSERLGDGRIAVGILYKNSSVQTIGPANTLDSGTFARRSRQPLAQRFTHVASGKTFMAVVNHFKAKSSCPEGGPDSDQGDGQACWNPARVASAGELDQWLNSLTNILGEQRIVLLGDFNSLRMEDPIQFLLERGWVDQVVRFTQQPPHTFNFFGAAGTLDYMFASEMMNADTIDARVWPINADYPIGGIENGPEYIRCSDHEPVLADFNL